MTTQNQRLKSLSLELGALPCNLRCPYCYQFGEEYQSASFREKREPLSIEEVLGVVDQARDLGLEGIGIIGPYEPIREEGILSFVRKIRERKLRVTIFTKGTYFNDKLAEALSHYDVTLGITFHSLCPDTHDELAGCKETHKKMMRGLKTLLCRGYKNKPDKILIQSVIAKQNLQDLPEVWRWAKRNSFVPFFERITIQGRAHVNISNLNIIPDKLLDLFCKIAEIDKKEFKNSWIPHPPWVGKSCERHLNSCHITFDGYVQPCTGVDIPLGNIRDMDILSILKNSRVIQELWNIRETIHGFCKECALHKICYGCRGQAYQLTGDYLNSDPCCWNNPERCGADCKMINRCFGNSLKENTLTALIEKQD